MPKGHVNPALTLPSLKLDATAVAGIHNGAVIYPGQRLKHSASLLRELRQLAYVSDACLDRTSLLTTGLPVKLVAAQCGHDDQRHFATRFRKHLGLPPGKCRESSFL